MEWRRRIILVDYFLTRAKDRRNMTDARAIPNISLDTDHLPVIMTPKQKVWRSKRAKHRQEERINLRVLNEEDTKQKFKGELRKTPTGIDLDALSMDETCSIFKASLIETLSKACGVKKAGKEPVKKTPWWNDKVKQAIKGKKRLYKAWVRSKLEEDYIQYRSARRHCKRVVKEAKEESWKKYGEQLSELCRHSPAISTRVWKPWEWEMRHMTLQQLSVTKMAILSTIRMILKPDGKSTSMSY